jgi:hypothetical protein
MLFVALHQDAIGTSPRSPQSTYVGRNRCEADMPRAPAGRQSKGGAAHLTAPERPQLCIGLPQLLSSQRHL